MPVAFQELGGSPIETYAASGFRAQRQFLIAWEDRDAFAVEVLGAASGHGGQAWVNYPGRPSAFAVRLRYEPFDRAAVDAQPLAGLAEGLNSYSGSWAKATVEYRTVNPRDRDDGPANEPGTHLTYRLMPAAVDERLSPRGWQWADDPNAVVPDDLVLVKRIVTAEHRLTWHQVTQPPWAAIRTLAGKVNAQDFLGCPAGTVLFEGAAANKLFRAGLDDGPSPFAWQIDYLFRERSVKWNGLEFGWNHFYREDPPGWAELTHGSDRVYDAADFAPLFQSATA